MPRRIGSLATYHRNWRKCNGVSSAGFVGELFNRQYQGKRVRLPWQKLTVFGDLPSQRQLRMYPWSWCSKIPMFLFRWSGDEFSASEISPFRWSRHQTLKLWSGRPDLNRGPSEPHVAREKGGGRLPPFLNDIVMPPSVNVNLSILDPC